MKYRELVDRTCSHVMVYGDTKSGKSTLVSQLATKGFKLYWFSLDRGHQVISKLPTEAQDNVEIFILPDTSDFPIAITTCLKVITGALCRICDLHGQIDCSTCKTKGKSFSIVNLNKLGLKDIVVFDHVSQLDKSAEKFVLKNKRDKSPNITEDYKFSYEDWRTQGVLVNRFFGDLQQSPFNSICIAQAVEVEMEDGTKKLVPEIGTRNVSSTAGQYFDHMVLTSVVNASHKFGSASTYSISAVTGSRTDICIEELEVPSLEPFFSTDAIINHSLQGSSSIVDLASSSNNAASLKVEDSKDEQVSALGIVPVDSSFSVGSSVLLEEHSLVISDIVGSLTAMKEEEKQKPVSEIKAGTKSKLEEIRERLAAKAASSP